MKIASYTLALLFALSVAGAYWYQSSANQCPVPLHYRIGNIAPSFTLSPDEAKAHAETAAALWEAEVDRDLFVYDKTADFTIDFVFDERQHTANEEAAKRNELDAKRDRNEEVRATVESLQEEYQALSTTYEKRVTAYEDRLAAHNQEVQQHNDRGGAPPEEYEALAAEQAALEAEATELSELSDELNALATEINELGERGNMLVETYNHEVEEYNDTYGFIREFTQGDYQGDHITIYKFSSENELETVLAHEFGHALGIGHVEGDKSLMYYLLEDTSDAPTLTEQDLAAYYELCGTTETVSQKVRRTIRDFLAKF